MVSEENCLLFMRDKCFRPIACLHLRGPYLPATYSNSILQIRQVLDTVKRDQSIDSDNDLLINMSNIEELK